MRAGLLAGLVAGSLTLSGCFATTSSVARLQTGFEGASQRAKLAEEAVVRLEDRIASLETTLREQGLERAAGRQTAEAVAADVARVRGTIEELQFEVQGLRRDLDAFRVDAEERALHAEARLAQLERVLALTPPPRQRVDGSATPAEAPPETPAPTPAAPATFDERLADAEGRMKDGKQAAARALLEALLATDPAHARASEVQYRLAETWFNEGRWREAARAFQVVTDRHAKSSWAPWAMLRIGECFEAQGRPGDARTFFDAVVATYPRTEAAKEAAKKLGR